MSGALAMSVRQGWWRSWVDEACEHERRKKTNKKPRCPQRPINGGPPVDGAKRALLRHGRVLALLRGCCCEQAPMRKRDMRKKELGPTDIALGLAWHR